MGGRGAKGIKVKEGGATEYRNLPLAERVERYEDLLSSAKGQLRRAITPVLKKIIRDQIKRITSELNSLKAKL